MACSVPIQNLGSNGGDATGSSPDITMTTTSSVEAGDRIVLMVGIDSAGSQTQTVDSISGGGLTWVPVAATSGDSYGSQRTRAFYADAPSGLANSTTFTAAVTGNFYTWVMAATVIRSGSGLWSATIPVGNKSQTSGTVWVTNSFACGSPGIALVCADMRSASGANSNTPDANSTEDVDFDQLGSQTMLAIIEHDLIDSASNYALGGTLASATDGGTMVYFSFQEGIEGQESAYLDPDAQISSTWTPTTNIHTVLDDAVREPGSVTTGSDRITSSTTGAVAEVSFPDWTIPDGATIDQILLHWHGARGHASRHVVAASLRTGATQWANVNDDGTVDAGHWQPGPNYTPPVQPTQAQINDIRARFTLTESSTTTNNSIVNEVYIEILYHIEQQASPQTVDMTGRGLDSAGALGTIKANQAFSVTALGSAGVLGTISTYQTFRVQPTGLGSAAQLGVITAVPGGVARTLTGLGSASALGAPAILVGGITHQVAGLGSAALIGSLTTRTGFNVSVSGLGSAGVLGSPTARPGNVTRVLSGVPSAGVFGSAIPAVGGVSRQVSGVVSAGVQGSVIARPGAISALPSGLGSASSLGAAQAQPGAVNVQTSGIPTAAVLGATSVKFTVGGLASASAIGVPNVSGGAGGPQNVGVSGVPSAGALGTSTAHPGNVTKPVTGLGSAGAFGSGQAKPGSAFALLLGIPSAGAFGSVTTVGGPTSIHVAALDSAAQFGQVSAEGGTAPIASSYNYRRLRLRRRF
jgi:hypothetical protein